MNLDPNDLLLFARVVDAHSFTQAAERLGVPKSTVSRRIAALEAQLGERLLLRTTRKLTVTDFGLSMLEYANQVAAEVEAAQSLAQDRQREPTGRLRISMPHDLATEMLAPMLARFALTYPAIAMEIDLTPRRVDLIGENFDVVIRMGELPDDASLAARKLADFPISLFAAPEYLARRGVPATPDELMQHDALPILARSGETLPWVLVRESDGARWEGRPPARTTINSPGMQMRLARAGAGILATTDHFAEPFMLSGEIVPVLPGWVCPPTAAWAVFPGRRLMPRRTRVFLDMLIDELDSEKCTRQHEKNQVARTLALARLPAASASDAKVERTAPAGAAPARKRTTPA